MMEMHGSDLAQLSAIVIGLLPKLSEREQVISLGLYRLLAEGLPVSRQQLATALNLPVDVVKETLTQWWGVYYDGEERITGYWGLALPQMAHRLLIDGKTLYAWCAWDTLFIPELLGQTVRVESNCPKTRRRIQLTVAAQGVSDLDPPGAVMSLLTPEAAKVRENVVENFCHYVHFFHSSEAGENWISEHPGTFLLSIEEAYALGKGKNAAQYKETLAPESSVRANADESS